MPLKSEAQRRWMHAAEARNEIAKGTAARWEHHTPNKGSLPERVGKKKRRRSAAQELARGPVRKE